MVTRPILTSNQDLKKSLLFKSAILATFVGMLLAAYATAHHLQLKRDGMTDYICNLNDVLSCDKVAQSMYSEFLGIPLGVWGFAFFLSLLMTLIFASLSKKSITKYLQLYGLLVVVGCLVSILLAYISSFLVGSFCLTCIGVYLVNFFQLLMLIILQRSLFAIKLFQVKNVFQLSWIPFLVIVGSLVLFQIWSPNTKSFYQEEQNLIADIQPIAQEVYDIPIAKSPYRDFGEDYRWGDDQAKVVIVEFADFECPACNYARQALDELKKEFTREKELLIVFRNYPLDQSCNDHLQRPLHKKACEIALLARCAGLYGKFWAYHDMAFSQQKNSSPKRAVDWAKDIGMTDQQVSSCLQDKTLLDKIKDDIKVGNSLNVKGTPAIFINGKRYQGERRLLRQEVLRILSS